MLACTPDIWYKALDNEDFAMPLNTQPLTITKTYVVKFNLGLDVAHNATAAGVPYPAGVGPATFVGAPVGAHVAIVNGNDIWRQREGKISVTFGPTVSVTNLSGATWRAGSSVSLELDAPDTTSGIPATTETYGTRLRRWRESAVRINPIDAPPLLGWQAWKPAPAWSAAAVVVGDYRTSGGSLWCCVAPGTAVDAPTGTGLGTIAYDAGSGNNVKWLWLPYTTGTVVAVGGRLYIITTGGLPATNGAGPAGRGVGITDGTATLDYLGPQIGPTVAFSAVATAALTSIHTATSVKANSLIRFKHGIPTTWYANGSPFTGFTGVMNVSLAPARDNQYQHDAGPSVIGLDGSSQTLVFDTSVEGPIVEIQLTGGATKLLELLVDGQYLGPRPLMPLTNQGQGAQFITLDFTNSLAYTQSPRRPRLVTLETNGGDHLRTIAVGPTSKLQRPSSVDDSFVVPIIGDSLMYYGATPQSAGWGTALGCLMGWPNTAVMSIIGTGYIATNGGANSNYITRALADLARLAAAGFQFPMIIVQGSRNDNPNTPAAVTAKALELYQALRAAGYTQPIVVIGYSGGADGPSVTNIAIENAVAAAVAAQVAAGDADIDFIPICTAVNPVFSGTGFVGATNSSGNTDTDIASDATHFTSGGGLVAARYTAYRLDEIIANMP